MRITAPAYNVDSSSAFSNYTRFDSSVFLNGVTYISSPGTTLLNNPYALVVDSIGPNAIIKYKELGTMSFASLDDYYNKIDAHSVFVDASGDTMTGTLTLDSSLILDGQIIDSIDTSIEGLSSSDTALATSALIKKYIDEQITDDITASNGLRELN